MLLDSRREDIRMNRRILTCTMIFLLAVAAGCKKQSNDQEAIRATIDKHLNARADLNLSAMDREVKQISVNGTREVCRHRQSRLTQEAIQCLKATLP